ncbi:MAG: acyltransferase [Rikenellaceae bacterium]
MNRFWDIKNDLEFEALALDVFRFQARSCAPYAEYLDLVGCDIRGVGRLEQIPFLPIELFKSHDVYSAQRAPEVIFTSSSTTGRGEARHMMSSLGNYEEAFVRGFERFYGDVQGWSIYGLLPSYLQREGSSLVYMVDRLIERCGSGGFYLDDYERLLSDMEQDEKPKILLGVSYALWDLVERYAPKLSNTIVMETGGMKGKREEIEKSEFHKILCEGFGVEHIHSEYGMAELTSQAYSKGANVFECPEWMKVVVRDINDPMSRVARGQRGGINIVDLASRDSCAFVQTQDMGREVEGGGFTIEGRVEASDIRGCNLLVQ